MGSLECDLEPEGGPRAACESYGGVVGGWPPDGQSITFDPFWPILLLTDTGQGFVGDTIQRVSRAGQEPVPPYLAR